ncbi:AraC family transcriptional regulator [Lentisphaera profundi]|uniref:AraC family transcriptional regulator n=1 Tax=Lentisphaera profundi TaxID=1658616 RepID=A0ABY7VNK5_9BACT|nr:helix-turn-helix domain-containing protein [Lentisphaera profundi]WDE95706.1 AraC family transcriptional regulator [Lentisphaera profundi]
MKNKDCEIIAANQLLSKHMGYDLVSQLIGKNDFDIFPYELATQYRNDDLEILKSAVPKYNIIELFPNYLGDLNWFKTSKIPLFNQAGKVEGICGTLIPYENSDRLARPYIEIHRALDFIKENYCDKLSNKQLAKIAGLSVRQFEVRFKEIFECTVRQYIIKLKILKSCKLLTKKNMNIAEVAYELGFCDQSSFSNTFKKQIGLTPLKYVLKFRVKK